MASLQLNIPDPIKATAEGRAKAAGFASLDEYIASLMEGTVSLIDLAALYCEKREYGHAEPLFRRAIR